MNASLNRTAFAATWHCLTGCAIGEVLGLVIATALDWGHVASIASKAYLGSTQKSAAGAADFLAASPVSESSRPVAIRSGDAAGEGRRSG